jgi:hypothetical protein
VSSAQRIVVPALTADEQDALDELVLQWRAKRPRNAKRSAMYDMKNATRHLMAAAVPSSVKRRAFVLGWSATAVDKLNRRCNIDGFYDRNGTNLDDLGMDDLWDSNRLGLEISRAGLSCLTHSVSWIVTTQGDESAGEPPVLMLGRSALNATGMWSPRLRSMRSFLSLNELDDKGEPVAMTMYLPNLNVIMTLEAGVWKVDRRDHVYGVPVDPMVYKGDLERPFGRSRITRAVMSIHEQALAAMIRADVNGEAYSLPRYVLLGATESAFQNADGSPKPTWQAAWDAIWAIGDDKEAPEGLERADVKQFTGQTPEPQNAHLRMLAQMFSGETGIPIGELGIIGDSNPTSADAMTISKDDLISEAEMTTDGWSPDLSSAVTRGLTMLNEGDVPDDLRIVPQVRNPMHESKAAAADAGTKIVTQIPWLAESEVGLEIMGLTRSQIDRAMSDKRRAQGQQTLAQIAALANAQQPQPQPQPQPGQ